MHFATRALLATELCLRHHERADTVRVNYYLAEAVLTPKLVYFAVIESLISFFAFCWPAGAIRGREDPGTLCLI